MMTRLTKLTAVLTTAVLLSAFAPAKAQTTTDATPHKHKAVEKKKVETATEIQVRELREKLEAQQAQIDSLKTQVANKDQQAATAQQSAADAQTAAAAAAAAAAQANTAASAASAKADDLSTSVSTIKTTETGLQETVIANQTKIQEEIEAPSSLHYKGVTITPGGFVAFEGVWRQHSVNSDVNTPLNSIPFPSAAQGHVSELNFSGRQSRLSALVQGDTGSTKLTGYYEMDWLGSGTTSNSNQSNSYVLRQRQIWGQAAIGGFKVTGGQMWSLVTEDRKGADPRTEIQPNTIDAQYLVGYSWTRQPELRLEQTFGDYKTGAFTAALSVEQAQITSFTVGGSAAPTEYFFAGGGTNGGLFNAAGNSTGTGFLATYANNVAPDVIVKGVYDVTGFHFELGGIVRFLRDYYNPILTTTGSTTADTYTYSATQLSNTKAAGGIFAAARGYMGKFAEVAIQGMGGTGVGRYGSSQLADATLRPDETLEPIKNYHGLFSLETHPTPKLDVYAYFGGEYAQRTVYQTATGALIGYAPPNLSNAGCYNLPNTNATNVGTGTGGTNGAQSCAEPTKNIEEAMFGLTYKAVNSPKYGRLQYQLTYSYIQRELWAGTNAQAVSALSPNGVSTPVAPRATEPMIHVSMRYYIP